MDTTDTTIDAIAHKAVSTPDDLTTAERVRLGAWVVDRREQIAAHYEHLHEASAANAPVQDRGAARPFVARPAGDLTKRLEPNDPTKQIEATTDTAEHAS